MFLGEAGMETGQEEAVGWQGLIPGAPRPKSVAQEFCGSGLRSAAGFPCPSWERVPALVGQEVGAASGALVKPWLCQLPPQHLL